MLSVVWWTCALSALAAAHVYERCELARALSDQGIGRDHLATWVCIAYHESRFDTAAQNYNSGDHGLLQISQLYWCGPGKACGVSCASLRDEDISNDVKCALRIYEEHTKIQGDGFMAWVVYPLYCKQNTKKYLEGCEESLKNTTAKVTEKSLSRITDKPTSAPSFLSISSILRGQYENEVNSVTDEINWLEYKFDNVDELTLPKYDAKSQVSESDISLKAVTNAIVSHKYQPGDDEKPPAYLTIPAILQEYFENLQRNNEGEKDQPNWMDITFDNIDELKLPAPGIKKNSVVTLTPTKFKTRIKIADTNKAGSMIPQNAPDYLKITPIVGQYYDSEFESNKPNNNQQKSWSDFAIQDIDKLVVPNKVINEAASLTPFATRKSYFETTKTYENENKLKPSPNLPAFMAVASIVQNQVQKSIDKIETNLKNVKIQNGGEFNLFSLNKGTSTGSSLSTPITIDRAADFEYNLKGSQNLPTYLNIIRQISGNEFQQDNIFKTIASNPKAPPKNIEPEPIQPRRRIEAHKYRYRGRVVSHTSTTPESPTTEKPPPPVKPSRRIESNEFRHRSTLKPRLESQFETNISKTTAQTLTQNPVTTITYKPTTNTAISPHNIYQYSLTTSNSVKNESLMKLITSEPTRKTNFEGFLSVTTEKNGMSIPGSWNTSTSVPIIQSITTQRIPSTKVTQSIFDFYLKSQRTSSTSSPQSWLDLGTSSQRIDSTSTTSNPQLISQRLKAHRPWLASTSDTQGKELIVQSSLTTSKPWYLITSSASNSQQTEATTLKAKATNEPWATRRLSTGSWSIPKADSTTLKTTRYDVWAARNYSTSKPWSWSAVQPTESTTSRTTTAYDPWAKQDSSRPTSSSTLPQTETNTPKTIYNLLLSKNYSTSKPWSRLALGQTDMTTQTTTKTSYSSWPEYSLSTSKSWSLLSSQHRETTEKSKSSQFVAHNISTHKSWSWSNTSSSSSKLVNATTTPSFTLNVSTSKPWGPSNTTPAAQKPKSISPARSWTQNSTRMEPQRSESTTQTPSTFKPRFTWDLSNPWSWSWATTPSILESINPTTQSITKSWDSRSFSTYRPWSWMTTTPTPKSLSANNSFSQSNVSTMKSPLSSRAWSTSPQKLNVSHPTTPPSATVITKPSTPDSSTTQSLFDLYLSNFGRTPLKGKQDRQSAASSHSLSEVSQVTARGIDSRYSSQTT